MLPRRSSLVHWRLLTKARVTSESRRRFRLDVPRGFDFFKNTTWHFAAYAEFMTSSTRNSVQLTAAAVAGRTSPHTKQRPAHRRSGSRTHVATHTKQRPAHRRSGGEPSVDGRVKLTMVSLTHTCRELLALRQFAYVRWSPWHCAFRAGSSSIEVSRSRLDTRLSFTRLSFSWYPCFSRARRRSSWRG